MRRMFGFPVLAALMTAGFLIGTAVPVMGQDIVAAESKAGASAPKAARRAAVQNSYTQVYLLRGLLNIFSLGMDDLAQKLEQRGIRTSVHNHSEWESLAAQIVARYRAGNRTPVILIGHSLGADAVMFMGDYLGTKGVPVALIVPFDGTGSFAAGSNVQRVMNLTQRDYAHMRKGAGFRGELVNIDVSGQGYGHTDIDKSARLHDMVIKKVVGVLGRGGSRTAAPKAAPSASGDAPAAATAPAAASPAPNAGHAGTVSDVSASTPAIDKKPAVAN